MSGGVLLGGSYLAMYPSTNGAATVSTRVSLESPLHPYGPNDVTPTITSVPPMVMNAGPPESPWQVLCDDVPKSTNSES